MKLKTLSIAMMSLAATGVVMADENCNNAKK